MLISPMAVEMGVLSNEIAVNVAEMTEIVRLQREYENGLVDLVSGKPLILLSDLEGPFILGDTAMEVVKRFFPNDNGKDFYNDCYGWYDPLFYQTGLSQEAGDVIMGLPILLAYGVTGKQILEVAKESKPSNGSRKVINLVQNRGGLVFGVTSAWSQHHRLVTEAMGIDGLFGTEFPIDEIREKFGRNEKFLREMEGVRDFAEKYDPTLPIEEKNQKIKELYMNTLGIRFIPGFGEEKSITGTIINQLRVVGDRGKLEVFKRIKGKNSPVLITMGDGLNDKLMLAESEWSIAINGPSAVKGAKIGVITDNMDIVADIIDSIATGNVSSPSELVGKFRWDMRGLVHLGKERLPKWLVEEHRKKRKEIRGEAANF